MATAAPWVQLARHADLTLKVSPAAIAARGASAGADLASAMAAEASSDRLARSTRAMRMGDWETGARLLEQELDVQPESWVALDLRAACCLQAGRHEQALDDALACTKLNPGWARGWARLGAAHLCMSHPRAAAAAYRRGLTLDQGNQEMVLGLQLAQAALHAQGPTRRRAMRHGEH